MGHIRINVIRVRQLRKLHLQQVCIAPTNGTLPSRYETRQTFRWSAVKDAVRYELEVGSSGVFEFTEDNLTDTEFVPVVPLVSARRYMARIRAFDRSGTMSVGDYEFFQL